MQRELETLQIGHTTVINGIAVTRWSLDWYEIRTWGREVVSMDEAFEMVIA